MIVLTHQHEDVKPIIRAFRAATRSGEPVPDSMCFDPITCNDNRYLAPVVGEWIQNYKTSRMAAPMQPRSYTSIIDNDFTGQTAQELFSEAAAQQDVQSGYI